MFYFQHKQAKFYSKQIKKKSCYKHNVVSFTSNRELQSSCLYCRLNNTIFVSHWIINLILHIETVKNNEGE